VNLASEILHGQEPMMLIGVQAGRTEPNFLWKYTHNDLSQISFIFNAILCLSF